MHWAVKAAAHIRREGGRRGGGGDGEKVDEKGDATATPAAAAGTYMMVIDALGGKGNAPVRLFPPKFLQCTHGQGGKHIMNTRRQGGGQVGRHVRR